MIGNEIFYYVNGFFKWNIGKKTSYVIGTKNFLGKICVLYLRNKRKSIFARVIIRNKRCKKITKETGKITIKSTYRWNNRKWSLGNESLEKNLCILGVPYILALAEPEGCNLSYWILLKTFLVKLRVSRLGLHWAFRI